MQCLEAVKLTALMARTHGHPDVKIGLIDGPVAMQHPDLSGEHLRELLATRPDAHADRSALLHGTFVAGILSARRGSTAPAICPGCTLLIRPVFTQHDSRSGLMTSASPRELGDAIIACIGAGARLINLSLALVGSSTTGERHLREALDLAAARDVIIVAAAGNQGTLGGTLITQHPRVIPVVACDQRGRPLDASNLGSSIGRRGLTAPGDDITSLNTEGPALTSCGTSVAAPFVTGAIALLWSAFPAASAAQITQAVSQASVNRRASVVPPLMNAEMAFTFLRTGEVGG
ncbi:MAG: S8 family serine peptidase [Planctomycetes bacterium]|nr:S8 family serine peptidase [Planctomycetota bacterium]